MLSWLSLIINLTKLVFLVKNSHFLITTSIYSSYSLFKTYLIYSPKNQYFHVIREAKTSCWNSFLEKAQGKEVFTTLKYTKERTLRIIPSLQYSKDGITRLVESFKGQCKAFTNTLFPKPPPSTSPMEWKDYTIDNK